MKMLLELDETEEPEEPLAKALGVASITLKLILGCPSVIELQNFTPEVEALQNRIAEAIGLVNSEKNVSLEKLEAVCKNLNDMYEMDGTEALGSYLRIYPCSEDAPELSECSFQWYRLTSDVGKKELVSDIDGKREKEEMLLATLTCSSIRFVHYRFLSRSPASIPAASAAPSPLPCVLTSFGIFGSRPTMDSNSSSSSSSFSTFSHSSPSGGRRGRGLEMKDYSRERLRGRGGGGSYNGPGGGKDKIDALGRLLSRILRHMASELNLNMRSDGFVKVEDLLKLNIKTLANIPLLSHTVELMIQKRQSRKTISKDLAL